MEPVAPVTEEQSTAKVCNFCNKTFKFNATLRQHEKIHYGIKQFECAVCQRRFLHKGTLKCHLRMHTGETPYKCPHCPKSFRGQTALNCHVFRHTKTGVQCPECGKVFATRSIVKQHLQQVHTAQRPHVCNVCGITYKYLKTLRLHLRTHEKRVCPECDMVFHSVYAMRKHRKSHTKETWPFRCTFCGRRFEKQVELKSHGKLRGRPFQCTLCCHSFNERIFLTNHERRNHWKQLGIERLKMRQSRCAGNQIGPVIGTSNCEAERQSSPELGSVACRSKTDFNIPLSEIVTDMQNEAANLAENVAGTSSNEETLTVMYNVIVESETPENDSSVHEITSVATAVLFPNTSSNAISSDDSSQQICVIDRGRSQSKTQQEVMCETCGKLYSSAATLAVHRTNHHQAKRFSCTQCERSFGYRCHLDQHFQRQHRQEQLACKLCAKTFKYAQDLHVHMKHHQDAKPYKCDQCTSTFRFPSALRSHLILHKTDRPFRCEECGKSFRYDNSLRVHRRLHADAKQYECEICHHKFFTKHVMVRHMKVHARQKGLNCEICQTVFYKKRDLIIHQTKEHSSAVPIYGCDICGKEFVKKCNLQMHSYLHEEVLRFVCMFCNQGFKQYSGLRNHTLRAHPQSAQKEIEEKPAE
ncbi:zinc finger protein ZFP2-like [Anopheles aquasalis]|uniref:zinc finger protein ZFP2-like n=1 Tax=Anopheles aquasalis TaxID=42839 RepID=UPI00215A4CA0|nr:zinc finger protein ZFP2-like [Anopheles aquasalis]